MQLQFNEYNFVSPHNLDNAHKHYLANRIFKSTTQESQERCHCCDRIIGSETKISFSCYNTKELLFLGPGIPLYFLVLRQSSFVLLVCLGVFGIYSLVTNYMGTDCQSGTKCTNNAVNRFSIMNNFQNTKFMEIGNYLILCTIIILIIVLQLIRKQTAKLAYKAEKYIDLPSNYSMMLRRLPSEYSEWDIQKMIDERRVTLTSQEKTMTNNLAVQKIIVSYSLRDVIKTTQKNIKDFKKSVKKNVDFFPESYEKPKKLGPLAIVTFQHQVSKDFFITKPSTWQKFLITLWSAYLPYSDFRIRDQRISIQPAPQPDDIYWQNCGISYESNIMRRLLVKVLVVLLLFAGLAVQVIFKVIQSKLVNSQHTQVINISFSLAVTIINFVLSEVLELITKKQRLQTVTQESVSTAATLSILQFMNSGVIVMFSNIIVDVKGYTLDGLSQNMLTIMIINMFLPHLTLLFMDGFKPIQRIHRWRLNNGKNVYIQKQVNEAYEGSDGKIALKCVYIVKTIWLAMFFGVFIPLVIPISIVGIFAYYHLQKYMYLKHYKVPNMISQTLAKQTIDLLQYSPFLFALGNWITYLFFTNFDMSKVSTNTIIVIYINLAIATVFIFLPTDNINEVIFKFKKYQGYKPTYKEVQNNFNTDYDIANPIYHQMNKKKKNFKNLKILTGEFGNLFSFLCNVNQQGEGQKKSIDVMMMEMINTSKPLLNNQSNVFEGYISQKRPANPQIPTSDRLPQAQLSNLGQQENLSDNFVIKISEPNHPNRYLVQNQNPSPQINNQVEMNMINLLENIPVLENNPYELAVPLDIYNKQSPKKSTSHNLPLDADLSGIFDYMSPISRKGSSA